MRILLIDDEETIREIEASMLVQAGHTVDTARNNEDALALYDRAPYDVVLTDVEHLEEHGPDGGEGLELARVIRKKNPSQRIGFITAHYIEIPGYPTLHKGFEPEQFLKFVKDISPIGSSV